MLKLFRSLLQLSSIFMIGYLVGLFFTTVLAAVGVAPWIVPGTVGLITVLGAMVWCTLTLIYVPWVLLKRHEIWTRWTDMESDAELAEESLRRSRREPSIRTIH